MTTRYKATADQFIRQAREELAAGDLQQASEKAWGAAAQMIKAAAAGRGWEHNSHGKLFDVARRLGEDAGDNRIIDMFHAASALHQNFYENWMPADNVRRGIEGVEEFVRLVEPLIG